MYTSGSCILLIIGLRYVSEAYVFGEGGPNEVFVPKIF